MLNQKSIKYILTLFDKIVKSYMETKVFILTFLVITILLLANWIY